MFIIYGRMSVNLEITWQLQDKSAITDKGNGCTT